jgi:hypothetical protein
MAYRLFITGGAQRQLDALRDDRSLRKRLAAVEKALRLLQANPRHTGLRSHKMKGWTCPHGSDLFEVYAENRTPAAYRIFYCYPPNDRGVIWIIAITPHP